MDKLQLILNNTFAIFIILSPFSILPIVLALIVDQSKKDQRCTIKKASITAFFVLIVAAIGGQFIFNMFHITIGAFRIAGGIFLFIMAMSMMHGGNHPKTNMTPGERKEAQEKDDVTYTPLAIPLIAGPGAITTVIGLMEQSHTYAAKGSVIIAVTVAVTLTYITLLFGAPIANLMGKTGLKVMTRIMGLMVSVVSVQFVINGMRDALPQILG